MFILLFNLWLVNRKKCIFWFALCLNLFYNLFCLTPCVFCPATQSRPPLFIGATLYKTRSKIIFKISIFGKYIFEYEFLYLLLIDLYWAFGVAERSRGVIFDYLKALKIAIILCILGLIVVYLGFYYGFWGLDLWDLMICGLLVGIFDDVWFDVLIGDLLGFVRMVVAKILEWILVRFNWIEFEIFGYE